ncbi:cation transporter, partial [Actinotignum timonense]|nr:cation transporter [Actinotignum timonense]
IRTVIFATESGVDQSKSAGVFLHALLVDAGHMLTDSAGLVMALVAAHLTTKPATNRRTWGYARAEIISACLQATLLLGVGIFV